MHEAPTLDLARIAQDLQIRKVQVESVVTLLDEGNTVPFITRYRKERTGGLNEDLIRQIQKRIAQQRQLGERKQAILKSIENQGKLTDELKAAILGAENAKRLEDLYLPYKPKKKTLASAARDKGLEPFALALWNRDPAVANLAEVLPTLVNPEKELASTDDVLLGAQHILAELIAEIAEVRAAIRAIVWDTGKLTTAKSDTLAEGQGLEYKDYFQFTEPVRHIPPHRILAINRGEKANVLKPRLEFNNEIAHKALFDKLPMLADHPHAEFLKKVAEDALARLVLPSLEREVRRDLTERSESHAVSVFARNLRSLLLQPPLHGKRILAVDPGFRTGCKLAALDEHGNLLGDGVMFPHAPQNKKDEARHKLEEMVRRHQSTVIAIGNGTACRETEEFVAGFIAELAKRREGGHVQVTAATATEPAPATTSEPPTPPATQPVATEQPPSPEPATPAPVAAPTEAPAQPVAVPPGVTISALGDPMAFMVTASFAVPAAAASAPKPPAPPPPDLSSLPEPSAELAYIIVNEAGASVYSASPVGREEFPNFDATLRGTISIGRRLQDPLSELVKIDPQNIGVGLYQHDVNPRHLKESLEGVIESSVNHVGVDLNTASVPLLRHVSGLNQLVARELVEYRKQNGAFKSREQLLQVPGVGPARYVQAAGFLKIVGGDNPLDRTWIHPESYAAAQQLLTELGYAPNALEDRQQTDALREKLKSITPEEVATRLQVGLPTLKDILEALARPGRDPREDLPPPIFKKGILKLEDLQPDMELKGTVLNVVDFGAFVDIGLKDSGLVHISQMANRYIKSPYDVVLVGDVVTVWVLTVDKDRRRVSLTMIKPGTERKPEKREEGQAGERPPRGDRPPRRGRRPAPAGAPGGGGPRRGGRPPLPPSGAPAQGEQAPPAEPGAAATQAPPSQAPPPRPLVVKPPLHVRPPLQVKPPPPRKPPRQVPKPKLTQAALQGKAPLRTFNELTAFFDAKKEPPTPPPAPPQAAPAPVPPPAEPTSPAPEAQAEAAASPAEPERTPEPAGVEGGTPENQG